MCLVKKSALAKRHLAEKQRESLRAAERTHCHQTKVWDGSRLKVSTNPNVLDRRVPGPQRQPLIPSTEGSAYVGGGEADDDE